MNSFALVTTAALCPSCPTTERVRCIVFGEGFFTNVMIAVLPFTVIAAITLVVHRAFSKGALHG